MAQREQPGEGGGDGDHQVATHLPADRGAAVVVGDRLHLLVGEQLRGTVGRAIVEVERLAVVAPQPERDGAAVERRRGAPHRDPGIAASRAVGARHRIGLDRHAVETRRREGIARGLDGLGCGEVVRRLEPARQQAADGDERGQHRDPPAQADLSAPEGRG